MVEQQEKIRITASETDLVIAIEGGVVDLVLAAGKPIDLSTLKPGDNPDEYVMTLEFGRHGGDPRRGRPSVNLQRLDAHIRNVTIRLRDDGYVLEGEMAGWVGYTGAAARFTQ